MVPRLFIVKCVGMCPQLAEVDTFSVNASYASRIIVFSYFVWRQCSIPRSTDSISLNSM